MKQVLKYTSYILIIALAGYLLWRFYYMIIWVLVAAVISFIGHPLVRFFDSLHIRKLRIPHALSTLLSLLIIVCLFLGLLAIFVPLIVTQARAFSEISVDQVTQSLEGPLLWLDDKLHSIGVVPVGQTIQDYAVEKIQSIVNLDRIPEMLNNLFSVAGTILIGLFSVLFIAFFFIKDEDLFEEGLLLFIPEKHHAATRRVIADSRHLLVRYFIGVVVEVIGVMSIISLGLWIFGVKNALLIGFFGGIMNMIPYLGPWIGSIIGISLGVTTTLIAGNGSELLPILLKLVGVFLTANFIDNNVLVPTIYSSSVKAHPLEIFLIIIIAGSLAGIVGMIFAVPVYTILRVIAREFFQKFRIVKKLTEKID